MATKITEASLTCSICLRRFRKPRALPCLHSYCQECLIEYAPSGTQVMMCPLCQEKVSIPDGDVSKLKLDFRLQSQVEEADRYDKEAGILNEEIVCNCCEDESPALAKCEQCDQLLCTFGVKAHKNMTTLRSHDVVLTDTEGFPPVGQLEKRIDVQAGDHSSDDDPIEKRAILVSNIPDIKHSPERVRDRITIHFQRKRHGGGDVDGVLYPVKGCPQNAVVVFNDKETCVSVIKCVQFLEDFQVNVTVEPLPQIFKEAEAEVNTFYWNLVPRLTTTKLIDDLSKKFGKTNLQVTKHILTKVKCPMSQLEEVHSAIVKAVGLGTSRSGHDAIDKGIIIKNIPYLTDEIQQLRGELTKHLESEGADQLQSLICPIQGNTKEAIAVFKTFTGCEEYMKRSDTSFYGDTLSVTKLPPVFECIHARLEDFFVILLKHLGLPTLVSKLKSCGDGIIVGDIDLTGSSEQLLKATDVIRDVTGLSKANLFSKPFGSDDTGDNITATHITQIHPGKGNLNKRRAEAVVTVKRKSGEGGASSRRVGDQQPQVKSKADSIWGRRKEDRSSQKSHEVIDITTSGRNLSGAWPAISQPPDVEDVSSEDFVSIEAIAYKCLSKTAADELRRIKTKFKIGIDITTPDNKKPTEQIAVFRPLPNASIQDLINAKEQFITLYQDSFFKIKRTPLTQDTKADDPGAKETTDESNAATPPDSKHISKGDNLDTPTAFLDADSSEISRGNFDKSELPDETKSDQKVERETSTTTTTSNISEIIPNKPFLKANQTKGITSKEKYEKLDKDQTSLEAKSANAYQERTGTLESTTPATIAKTKQDNSSEPAERELKQALGEESATEVHEKITPSVPSKIKVETERGPTNVYTLNNKDELLVDSTTTSATSSHDPSNVQSQTSVSSCRDNKSNIENDIQVNSDMKKVPASATSGSNNPTSWNSSNDNELAMEDGANSRTKSTSKRSEVTATVETPNTASNEKPPIAQGKPTMKTPSNQEAHEPINHDSLGSEETGKKSKASKRKLDQDAANALPNVENVNDAKKLKERQETDTIVGDMQIRQSPTCTQAKSTGNKEDAVSTTSEKPQGGDGHDSTRREGNEQSRRQDIKSSQKNFEHVEVTDSINIFESNSSCARSAKTQPPDVDDVSSEDFVTIDAMAYKCLSKTAADKLKRIKTKFKINIDIKTPDNKKPTEQIAVFMPLPNASIQDLINAKEEFITLYQDSFFKIRRTPLTCDGLSQEVATHAIQETERKVQKIVIHRVKQHEYVFCGEEAVVTEAIAIFRQEAGNQPKPRRLMKKTFSGSNSTGSSGFSHPAATDQHKGSGTLENVPSAYPSAFYTKERLNIKVLGDDITKQKVDIIVNAANGQLEHNGGVAQAIANAAGKQLQDECNNIMWNRREKPVQIGECILTKAYRLNSKFVIHTVGPRYQQTNDPNVFFRELVDTFANVLRHAESQAAQSIAIPLISSGTYGGPKEICANALATALLDFSILASRKHVQQIFLVNIDQKATAMLQSTFAGIFLTHDATDDRLTKAQKVPQQAIKKKMTFTTPEGIEVIVEKGDITKGNVEVIVNAANGRLAHGGGVAGAISYAAGRRLQDESDRIIARRGWPLAVGEIAVTEGYNINCNKVIHAVRPVYSKCRTDKEFVDQLRATFTAAIKHANLPIETKRVAFPLISSGIYGGPKQLCAQAFVESVKEFSRNERNLNLKQIYMVNIDDEATNTVCHACEACFSKDSESSISQSQNPILPSKQDVPEGYCGTTNKGIAVHVLNANIVKQNVDVIVNPTTPTIRHGGGISAAISDAAGYKLQKHCNYLFNNARKTKPLSIGETIVTEGFNLPCKTIIHTLGPVFETSKLLAFWSKLQQTFLNCMKLANNSNEAKTIAFPLIASSTGPKETCAKAFADAIHEFDKSEAAIKLTHVIMVANDSDSFLAVEKTVRAYFQSQPTSGEGAEMPYDTETRSSEYVFRTKENMKMRVRTDDIAKQSTDVVLSYTDENMTNQGQIAARLRSAAGPRLQKECDKRIKKNKSLSTGSFISTEGFKLPCKQVLHLSVLSGADCGAALRQTYLPSLLCAKTTLQAKSIAIPLIESDRIRPDESVRILASALKQFSSQCVSFSSQRPITIYVVGMSSTVTTTVKKIFLDHFRLDGDGAQTSPSSSSGVSGNPSVSGQQFSTPITTQPPRRVASTDGLHIPSASSNHKQAQYSDVVKGAGIAPPDPKQSSVYNSSSQQNMCGLCKIQKDEIHILEGCKHKACFSCIETKITPNSSCQECGAVFGLVKEQHCSGKMKYYTKTEHLKYGSHFKDGFIVMDFNIPSGTQNTSHTHPGSTFKGMSMLAYLPNTKEGLEVLFLIRWAFLNCQLFKITTSALGGDDRLVLLGDIPLKFKYHGGFDGGYPDSKYLPQVRRILESRQAEFTRACAAAGRVSAADGTYE